MHLGIIDEFQPSQWSSEHQNHGKPLWVAENADFYSRKKDEWLFPPPPSSPEP
jgi:hypothetical protein